jgi:hypothetical protein
VVKAVDDVSFTVGRGKVLALWANPAPARPSPVSPSWAVDPPGRVVRVQILPGPATSRAPEEEDARLLGNRIA